jgi:CopG family nickel-responsive transcriptional regulator
MAKGRVAPEQKSTHGASRASSPSSSSATSPVAKGHRVTISLPADLHDALDELVEARGIGSRSQAICEMIRAHLLAHSIEQGSEIMMGTIQLVYDHSVPSLQSRLTRIQHEHIDEVISSFHVHLEHDATLEIILVQGPASRLREIANRMISCRGVLTGNLQLSTTLLPPLHSRQSADTRNSGSARSVGDSGRSRARSGR